MTSMPRALLASMLAVAGSFYAAGIPARAEMPELSVQTPARQHPATLVALAKEFRQWRSQTMSTAQVPDYAARVVALKEGLAGFRTRLERIDPSAWSVHDKVDYLVLRAEMDDLDFDLRVIRESSRNPDFYATEAISRVRRLVGGHRQRAPGVTVPYDAARADSIIRTLNETSAIVGQAAKNLTEGVPQMADVVLDRLERVRENYKEFATLVAPHVPEPHRGPLVTAADAAGAALEKYREWVRANRSRMTAPYAVGRKAFEWYVQRVLMMPYDSEQLLMQAEMERVRNWAFLQFERQNNRDLPPLRPARTNKEYKEWLEATDVLVRVWAEDQELFTRPDHVGAMRPEIGGTYLEPFGFIAFPTQALPAGTQTRFLLPTDHWFSKEYYWERNERFDPAVNHPHSEYPGHAFEGMVSQRTTCDLRRGHNSRGDSWTNYIEEVQLQLDYPFVRGRRAREVLYGFAIGRAERVYAAVKFADGSLTPAALEQHMLKSVPLMDPFVAREHEVWRKYLDPAKVLTYQVGKFRIYKLMTDRMAQLGDKFDLREFHDQLLATGQIPVTLARWEMTGLEEEAKALWAPAPLPVGVVPTNSGQP